MKATQSDCILEFAERRFNSPTHCVELFEFVRREFVARQIGDHAFVSIGRQRKTDNTECHRIELILIQKIKELNAKMEIPEKIEDLQKEDILVLANHARKEANPLYPVPRILNTNQLVDIYERLLC